MARSAGTYSVALSIDPRIAQSAAPDSVEQYIGQFAQRSPMFVVVLARAIESAAAIDDRIGCSIPQRFIYPVRNLSSHHHDVFPTVLHERLLRSDRLVMRTRFEANATCVVAFARSASQFNS
jgi:hypothetical protein